MTLIPECAVFEPAYLKGETQIVFTRLGPNLETQVHLI